MVVDKIVIMGALKHEVLKYLFAEVAIVFVPHGAGDICHLVRLPARVRVKAFAVLDGLVMGVRKCRCKAEGLAPVVRHDIEKALIEVRKSGITTIIVEQNAVAALKLADRAIILDTGEVAFTGTAKQVLDDEQLRHNYLAI